MAKAGFWLRGSKGKLAGASMGKGADGQTIIREIVTPKNPRTPAQLYQRAIMATVMRAYGAGKEIFDHSFEGFSVGAQNQREFTSRNARILRSLIAAEVNGAVALDIQKGVAVAPGTKTPLGFIGLVASTGSYPMVAFQFTDAVYEEGEYVSPCQWTLPAALENETCAAYAARIGLIAGDFFTFLGFKQDEDATSVFKVLNSEGSYGTQYAQKFYFVRFGVKDSFVNSTDAVAAKKMTDIFFLDTHTQGISTDHLLNLAFTHEITADEIFSDEGLTFYGTVGLIRSRKDVDLRSDCVLRQGSSLSGGIRSSYVLAAWQQGTEQLGDSEQILEGGGF